MINKRYNWSRYSLKKIQEILNSGSEEDQKILRRRFDLYHKRFLKKLLKEVGKLVNR